MLLASPQEKILTQTHSLQDGKSSHGVIWATARHLNTHSRTGWFQINFESKASGYVSVAPTSQGTEA